MKYQKMIVRFK